MTYAEEKLELLNEEGYSSLVDIFENTCKENSGVVAFSCFEKEHSYAEIDSMSTAFACFLVNDLGLQKGDRVAIQLPNITQYPIAVWAALRAGLIVVNTNPQYTAREQTHQFNDSGAKVLVVLEDLLPITRSVIAETGIEHVVVTGALDLLQASGLRGRLTEGMTSFNSALESGSGSDLPDPQLSMSDVAVLQYTGGTTGPSKGAMLSHGNLFSGMKMSRLSIVLMEPGDAEIPVVVLPLYHVFGFTSCVMGTTLHGGTSVLIPDPRNVDSIVKAMKSYPFTFMASVNTLLQALMSHPEFDEIDYSQLIAVVAGGTALVKEIADEWEQRTGVRILEGYGLSETSSTATCNRKDNGELGSVGPPLEHVELKIIDEQGSEVSDGERGEVCVRGAHIMQGYWNKPEATAEAIDQDGWFRTGDIGIVVEQGRLKIVDRIKDMIIVSGFNVYPNEVEAVIYGHPNIVECAAIGVPNDATGEAIKLFVVSNDQGLSPQDVIDFCRDELTAYKIPKQIVFAEDLPKSPAGKILRRELRELPA